jgi:hypothetical protein
LQRISLAKRSDALKEEEPGIDPLLIMDTWTNNFLKDIKAYNSGGSLANTIYSCKPEVEGFNPLNLAIKENNTMPQLPGEKTTRTRLPLILTVLHCS